MILKKFILKSKIDGCSLKRIGELPFKTSAHLKSIGIPNSSESSDQILLVDGKDEYNKNQTMRSVM